MAAMRIATFNLENLDSPLGRRTAVLRPAFERMRADIVCLQEVNGQHIRGQHDRQLLALDELLEGTPYASFHRAATVSPHGSGASDVHNLVTLSRYPILSFRQLHHDRVPPASCQLVTAEPRTAAPQAIRFDRPVLLTTVDIESRTLHVINVHLRAPLATAIPGGKAAPFAWKSISQWAEGFYLSGIKRAGQALEVRLLIDELLRVNLSAWVAAVGDFNAEDHETPLKIITGTAEDTGNAELTAEAMIILDRALDEGRRFSIIHHGRPQMVDHVLASRALSGHFRSIEAHNEALSDEALGFAKHVEAMGSYHAAVVAEFEI